MRSTTGCRSGWNSNTFDALLVALGADASDAVVRECIERLTQKGVAMSTIVAQARTAHGPRGAARVQQLVAGNSFVIQRSSGPARRPAPARRYRPSRSARLKRRIAELTDEIEGALSGFARRLETILGRKRRRSARPIAPTPGGRAPTPGATPRRGPSTAVAAASPRTHGQRGTRR